MTGNTFYNKHTTTSSHAQLIGDPNSNLKNDMSELTKEDLRERLYVAETVMKSLFENNKKLEVEKEEGGITSGGGTGACTKCETLEKDLQSKIDKLQARNSTLEVSLKQNGKDEGVNQTYKEFMTAQLEETKSEAKRHFESYVAMREKHN